MAEAKILAACALRVLVESPRILVLFSKSWKLYIVSVETNISTSDGRLTGGRNDVIT